MTIEVKTATGAYPIYLERGSLDRVGECFSLTRKVLIVTDDGVPPAYAKRVASQCETPVVVTLPQGEKTKQFPAFTALLERMVTEEFTRTDCVVAVGGGVVGDLAGFVASVYMRGIDFYNIPTTLLSQVDSSIGGKTAVDFKGYKNLIGAFYPPRAVLIDPDTLSTLPQRQVANGLAEAVKMALTWDSALFSLFETGDVLDPMTLDEVLYRALLIKKTVVEQDERECGLRRVLNFGHTLAHAVESVCGMETYYHGECVAIGMVPLCAPEVRHRLLPVLERLGLPTHLTGGPEALIEACRHDKKASGDKVTVVTVPEVGTYSFDTVTFSDLEILIREVLEQ